ncbi:unnamed protein product, partial [Polarella glacialis]
SSRGAGLWGDGPRGAGTGQSSGALADERLRADGRARAAASSAAQPGAQRHGAKRRSSDCPAVCVGARRCPEWIGDQSVAGGPASSLRAPPGGRLHLRHRKCAPLHGRPARALGSRIP